MDKKATRRHVLPAGSVELLLTLGRLHRVPLEARNQVRVFVVDDRHESFSEINVHGFLHHRLCFVLPLAATARTSRKRQRRVGGSVADASGSCNHSLASPEAPGRAEIQTVFFFSSFAHARSFHFALASARTNTRRLS